MSDSGAVMMDISREVKDNNEDQSLKQELLHPVDRNDPRKLHALLNQRVTVTTKNKHSVTGWVQTIDPVSESFLLVAAPNSEGGCVVSHATLVPGYNITGVRQHSDVASAALTSVITNMFRAREATYTEGEVSARRDALCMWFKKNRVPYTLNQDDSLQVLHFATLRPPYTAASVACTNEMVMDKIIKLMHNCPGMDHS